MKMTRYYGYMDFRGDKKAPYFVVKVIAPPRASIYQYVGRKDVKLSKLLCVDDFILFSIPGLAIDWSEVE